MIILAVVLEMSNVLREQRKKESVNRNTSIKCQKTATQSSFLVLDIKKFYKFTKDMLESLCMEFKGTVIKGGGYGHKLGYPTVNIDRDDYLEKNVTLVYGIYGGFVTINEGAKYLAGIVVGPEDSEGLPKLEAHLVDFTGDLYGEMVTFHIIEYLRPFKGYESEEKLSSAIKMDIDVIKGMNLSLPAI